MNLKPNEHKKVKVAYLHGRPWPHPMHRKFSEILNADFMFVDFKMRWQDLDKSMLYRVMSWFVCAFSYPKKKQYNVFLVDNLHFPPVIMKMLGLIRRDQKIVAHMGSHTLYFIYAHRFSKITEWMHIQALRRYDALICEGKMAEELANKILKGKGPKLYTVFNGIPDEHYPKQDGITKNLEGKNILFMGHGPGENRLWYKGLDLMLKSFEMAFAQDSELTFTIVGNWDSELKEKLISSMSEQAGKAVIFVGEVKDLTPYTRSASLYLHCARGEAYGITILIAMASGIPSIVSEWTGAKELVENIDKRFILPLQEDRIAQTINWYFSLDLKQREDLSRKSIDVIKVYTEENAITNYKNVFSVLLNDFKITSN